MGEQVEANEIADRATLIPAGWNLRLANLVIDVGALYVISRFVPRLPKDALGAFAVGQFTIYPAMSAWSILMVSSFAVEEAIFGKTLAKFITRTRVVREDGQRASVGQLIGRNFARLIPFDVFSAINVRPRPIHDMVSRTVVIDERKA